MSGDGKMDIGLEGKYRKVILTGVSLVFVIFLIYAGISAVSPQSDNSDFNRPDLMFMNMMIIHHNQAIEMSEMAKNRTENSNILRLSENISEAQKEENRKMADWLKEAGHNPPARGHRMAGMASEQEMEELRQSEGQEFDLLFSELMIRHHEGGIQMARAEVQNGRSEKVTELAGLMVKVQQEEIDKMETWKNDWVGNT